MPKPLQYRLVDSSSPEDFQKEVNRLLEDGWYLFGGHSTTQVVLDGFTLRRFTQVLVKYESIVPEPENQNKSIK